MSECTHDCSTCGVDCSSRTEPQSLIRSPREGSEIGKVIAVVSGKGGVGKSLVTALCASQMRKRGASVAILDADITGPSVPAEFGIYERAMGTETALLPSETKTGIKLMSMNLLLDTPSDPVVWRGPVIAGVVSQFWTDVEWGKVDYMFVDMPPGTGDVPLTIFQSLPVDGIIIVTSPQEMVGVIVEKAVKMAKLMGIPVIGIVENMSYFECPDCGKRHSIFGASRLEEAAAAYGIGATAALPIDPLFSEKTDAGEVESIEGDWLGSIVDAIEQK